MRRLSDVSLEDLGGGINVMDLGASGGVKPEWKPLAKWMNVIGFDPNAAECTRLNALPSGYHSSRFLPYAIADKTGEHVLYKTKSIYCWSLLEPRLEDWLSRFTYSALFEPAGTEAIMAYRLDEIPELAEVDLDAMKIDVQGMELPILKAALPLVAGCIWIETETGFTQNYQEETTFDQILEFMTKQGFGLFGIDSQHPIARKNRLSGLSVNEQLLWCEAVWLRDYLQTSQEELKKLTRAKALRALCLYANHGCLSFGLEAAGLFRDLDLITPQEYEQMARDGSWWHLQNNRHAARKLIRSTLDYVPRKVLIGCRQKLSSLMNVIDDLRMTSHPFKRRQ